jgi:feruloyl esterase
MTFFETSSVRKLLFFPAALMFSSAHLYASEQSPGACTDLLNVELNRAIVTVAEIVEAGTFAQPSQSNTSVTTQRGSINQTSSRIFQELPEFCRVAVNMTPSDDSDINMEIWIPVDDWNGKFLAVGNGAFTGNIRYSALIAPLRRGYATSSTDTGHLGNTASFGLGHPEKLIDFGWRAVHEMTVVSKQLIEAYYQRRPAYSYWSGCSAGGRQAMQEAQRFPDDFDGIIAGAPGLDWTGRAAASLKVASFLEARESFQLSAQKRELVYQAAINACDAIDGLEDGLISTPAQCGFDPVVLQCQGQDSSSCLTSEQVTTVRMLYDSPQNPATGR